MKQAITQAKLSKNVLKASLFNTNYQFANQLILNEIITSHICLNKSKSLYLAHHNLHSLALIKKNKSLQKYFSKADYVWLDGMSVVWILKLLKYDINTSWRTTFLDWDKSFFSIANKNKWKIFLLGSTKNNISLAADGLAQKHPNIIYAYHHGFISEINDEIVQKINEFKPDILLVGMGMPLQETWIIQNQEKLQVKITMPVGGYFDYIAGSTVIPPRWMGSFGLEWLARLVTSPRRLGYRYLIEPWPVFYFLAKELFKKK